MKPTLIQFLAPKIFLTAAASLVLFSGCARISVKNETMTKEQFPRPDVVVVHDFSVSADQVALDHTIGLRLQEMLGSQTDAKERMQVAQEIARTVTENIVQDLRKQGFTSMAASAAGAPTGRTLSIEGQFLSIDQGSQRRRLIVGFGLGASEVRALVQAFENTGTGNRVVDDFYVTIKSSARPGMGPTAGAGAAATSAAVSATGSAALSMIGASGQTVEADARHLADQVSAELKKFFARQGWTQ